MGSIMIAPRHGVPSSPKKIIAFSTLLVTLLFSFPSSWFSNANEDIVEWKILDAAQNYASAVKEQKPFDSASEIDKFKSLTDSYIKSIGSTSSQDSFKNEISHLEELTVTISVLQELMKSDEIQIPGGTQEIFQSISIDLESASKALLDVIDVIEKHVPNVQLHLPHVVSQKSALAKDSLEYNANAASSENISGMKRKLLQDVPGDEEYVEHHLSLADYEMRARGYGRFMAEDMQVNEVFHSNGDTSTFFSSNIFQNEDFNFFNSYSSTSHYDNRRRLNDKGVCYAPKAEDVKRDRCMRLKACANEYTMYDLFMYFFGDNMNESTGEFGKNEIIKHYDEKDLRKKFINIKNIAKRKWYSEYDCDDLLQQFHRYDEAKMTWRGGSVTSICRGWGATRKASLKAIYNFMRYKFTREVEDPDEPDKMIWKEVFPVTIYPPTMKFKVESGTGSEFFGVMVVTHEDAVTGTVTVKGTQTKRDSIAGVLKENEDEFFRFRCTIGYGEASYNEINSTCVDDRSFEIYSNDGNMDIYTDDTFEFSIYDFHALEMVGNMYDKFLGCADKIRNELKKQPESSQYKGLNIDLSYPWKGFKDCLNEHGRWNFSDENCASFEKNLEFFIDHTGEKMTYENFESYFNKANTNGNDRYYVEEFVNITDTMTSLMFGKKTTIGQVCSYAHAMTTEIVVNETKKMLADDLPGYCCLDSPDDTKWWGEQYSCTFEYGDEKGMAKSRENCTHIGPWWSSFNEDACDVYSGTWCPNPRSCHILTNCVKEEKAKVEKKQLQKAFLKYLQDAPEVDDVNNNQQCGELRQYLQYDKDFPDDLRICNELKHIQCRNDFADLDERTGGAEDSSEVELVVKTNLLTRKKEFFPSAGNIAWQVSNKVLKRVHQVVEWKKKVLNAAVSQACTAFVSAVPGSAAACVAATSALKTSIVLGEQILYYAHELSVELYYWIVTRQNAAAAGEINSVNYENIYTSATNGITTFKAIQQVKQMIGGLADDLNDFIEESSDGRKLTEENCNEDEKRQCGEGIEFKCSCEDKKYNCACDLNYDFIKVQRNAGCDGVDSDGDKVIDRCEDRFKPSLLLTEPTTFMCDLTEPEKLCFNSKIFQNETHARKFLSKQVQITDDCALQSQLDFDLTKLEGTSCSNTVFRFIPYQNYTECQTNENFSNPLKGNSTDIIMHVDENDPIVTCGFHDIPEENEFLQLEDKSLFHYVDRKGSKYNKSIFPNFFYTIEDDCHDNIINVNVDVTSNELDIEEKGAQLFPLQYNDTVEQVDLLYQSTSCDFDKKNSRECLKDMSIELPIRFYEITVSAVDSSGRSSSDTCKILIVPKCTKEDEKDLTKCEDKKTYKTDYLLGLTDNSNVRYPTASLNRIWDFSLAGQNFFFSSEAIARLEKDGPGDRDENTISGLNTEDNSSEMLESVSKFSKGEIILISINIAYGMIAFFGVVFYLKKKNDNSTCEEESLDKASIASSSLESK